MTETTEQQEGNPLIDELGGIDDNAIPGTENETFEGDVTKQHPSGVSILTEQQVRALVAPLNGNRVRTLSNNSYLQAWDVKAALIKVFGFGGFSADVTESSIVSIREHAAGPQYAGHTKKDGSAATPEVIAKATVRLTVYGIGPRGEDVTYTESAIGANSGWSIGDTADNAVKTASSSALKRCATYLGTQFGLSLYNNGALNDVVGVVLTPWQGKVVSDKIAERAEREKANVEAQLARATGQQQP